MQQKRLKSIRIIRGFELGAEDGHIGKCQDFLFDDTNWTIRYIVADTHKWLPGQKVLISPISIGTADNKTNTLSVELTRKQVKDSPPLATDSPVPVSRQYEILFNEYYDWGSYWRGGFVWGEYAFPHLLKHPENLGGHKEDPEQKNSIRSVSEVLKYEIQATDDTIGHVEDMIVEEETWIIRYLVVDTSNWLPGSKRVIFSPGWVMSVDWINNKVMVDLTKEQIKNCPEYDPKVELDRTYEKTIFDYYGHPYYW